jgi:hypothetical protein
VRERLALHFDAEGTLASKVVGNAYEVHLRMPYRQSSSTATADPNRRPAGADAVPGRSPKSDGAPLRFVANRRVSHG